MLKRFESKCTMSGIGFAFLTMVLTVSESGTSHAESNRMISLPEPDYQGLTLERVLSKRRTVREFSSQVLDLKALSQLLWAAQGITDSGGLRTAPSAGALYPLEIDVVAGNVEGVPSGVYRYRPEGHRLMRHLSGDHRSEVASAAWKQRWISRAAVLFIIRAVKERTAVKYGERANLYVPLEAGAATQNILLQAVSLGLAAATVGAFHTVQLSHRLGGTNHEEPLVIIPVGFAAT